VLGCRGLAARANARVLVGGLGMAYTLRAVLDALPASAKVTVAELNPVIVSWCRGPLAELTAGAADDPRVTVVIKDFAHALREAAGAAQRLDAVVIDLYVGPDNDTPDSDPLYGARACQDAFAALRPGGVFAVWAEAFHPRYAKRLAAAGFAVTHERPATGARRFVVYLATRPAKG
jgi:spermidine synthase